MGLKPGDETGGLRERLTLDSVLLVIPNLDAIARIIVVELTTKEPVYAVELVDGTVLLVV